MRTDMKDIELVNAKINDDYSSLSLTYKYIAQDGVHQRVYPCIPLHIYKNSFPIINNELDYTRCIIAGKHSIINAGYGDQHLCLSNSSTIFTDTLVEPRIEELTIKEIEKLLGYKVVIKSEDEL